MSKITFLGNFGVAFSSESHHKKSLEALGHEIIALQETQTNSETILDEAMKSDMFVWVHTHGWETPGSISMDMVLRYLKQAKIPSITYHLDLWLGLKRQADLSKDSVYKSIEYFFTCDKQMATWFNKNTSVKGRYLPAGVLDEECKKFDLNNSWTIKNDVIFVGSRGYHPEWPYRPQLIDWLRSTYTDKFTHIGGDGDTGTIRGLELNNVYSNSKVAVGDSLNIDFKYPYYWSDRLYESIGRGGFTIFPYIEGVEDEFDINKELIVYKFGDFEELKEKIDYFINNDNEREKIREAGFKKVINNYTYKNRWQSILSEVGL